MERRRWSMSPTFPRRVQYVRITSSANYCTWYIRAQSRQITDRYHSSREIVLLALTAPRGVTTHGPISFTTNECRKRATDHVLSWLCKYRPKRSQLSQTSVAFEKVFFVLPWSDVLFSTSIYYCYNSCYNGIVRFLCSSTTMVRFLCNRTVSWSARSCPPRTSTSSSPRSRYEYHTGGVRVARSE